MAKGDPYFTNARYAGSCAKCGSRVIVGDRILYYPRTKTVLGGACGRAQEAMRKFEAEKADEEQYHG